MTQVASEVARPAPESIRTERLVQVFVTGIGPITIIIAILMSFTLIGIPFALGLMSGKAAWNRSRAVFKTIRLANVSFPKFVGGSPRYLDITATGVGRSMHHVSASGIAWADGRLFVMEDGVAAEIPWARIRSWTWKIEGWETTDLYGINAPHQRIKVQRQNAEATEFAAQASGFVISVSDVEKPEWKFGCTDAKVLKKWHEILNQMKSGDLPRR